MISSTYQEGEGGGKTRPNKTCFTVFNCVGYSYRSHYTFHWHYPPAVEESSAVVPHVLLPVSFSSLFPLYLFSVHGKHGTGPACTNRSIA